MTRVEFGGQGFAIPDTAMPPPGADPAYPPQSFFLENGVPFLKEDWVGLGYTHYEVWCIGAAGGRGGSIETGSGRLSAGGGGGGGGLHKVGGLLADLPDACPVVVGQAGTPGANGNGQRYMEVARDIYNVPVAPYTWYPNPVYVGPQPGGDGGYSSFNGSLCRASGGKGGMPTLTDIFPVSGPFPQNYGDESNWFKSYGGKGGEGGCGDRILAGGGAPGAIGPTPPGVIGTGGDYNTFLYPLPPDGSDGLWDSVIGKGGGGGVGGTYHVYSAGPVGMFIVDKYPPSRSGGRGSFSYADTTVYGHGEIASPGGSGAYTLTALGLLPPSGGGARINKLNGYGSRASGYNPNGAVYIRITKVV